MRLAIFIILGAVVLYAGFSYFQYSQIDNAVAGQCAEVGLPAMVGVEEADKATEFCDCMAAKSTESISFMNVLMRSTPDQSTMEQAGADAVEACSAEMGLTG